MSRVAFINSTDYTIQSVYIPSSYNDPIMLPMQEPETPEGCFRMEIPATIIYTEAIKVIVVEDGSIELIPDEEKLAYLRNLALPHIRKTRNELLAMCDFRMMSDYVLPEETRQQWTAYRQALREITTQDPLNITWPSMPN